MPKYIVRNSHGRLKWLFLLSDTQGFRISKAPDFKNVGLTTSIGGRELYNGIQTHSSDAP